MSVIPVDLSNEEEEEEEEPRRQSTKRNTIVQLKPPEEAEDVRRKNVVKAVNVAAESIGGGLLKPLKRFAWKEATQTGLAIMIVISVPITVILAWVTLWFGKSSTDIKELTLALLSSLTGLSGAVLGYYYGKGVDRRDSGSRNRKPRRNKAPADGH